MATKIGEIITLPDGKKVEVAERIEGCKGCVFDGYDTQCCWRTEGTSPCSNLFRFDHKDIIYKEVK